MTDTKVCLSSRGAQSSPASLLGDQAERADHVVRAQRRPDPGREDQAVILPEFADHLPVPLLLVLLLA
jgi:hypothetical protein